MCGAHDNIASYTWRLCGRCRLRDKQRRYGAFTVSESAIETVRDYTRRQKEHHTKRTFEQEYAGILRNHNVSFDEKYLWD